MALKDEINCQHLWMKKSSHILSARPRKRQTAGTTTINLGPNYSQAKRQWWSLLLYREQNKKEAELSSVHQLREDELKKEVKPGRKKKAMFSERKQTLSKDTWVWLCEAQIFPGCWSHPVPLIRKLPRHPPPVENQHITAPEQLIQWWAHSNAQ